MRYRPSSIVLLSDRIDGKDASVTISLASGSTYLKFYPGVSFGTQQERKRYV